MKFRFGMFVRILKEGFYTGCYGNIIDFAEKMTPDGVEYLYLVRVESYDNRQFYFKQSDLELT